jgi:hypothetical protein
MVETLLVGQYMFLKIVFNLLNYLVSALASNWLGREDSNPRSTVQSRMSYL